MEENIINKFQTIYNNIVAEKGNTYLFMAIKMDEFVDKWSIVASASWITRENQRESFSYIVRKMKEVLNEHELLFIARVGIFQPDEHLVQIFNSSVRIQAGNPVKLENTKLNGFQVHEAYIFESIPSVSIDKML